MLLIKISWKNVWRNPIRSGVVITSVLLGLWAGIYLVAFSNALNNQRIADQLDNSLGHIKISHQKFNEEKLPEYFIQNTDKLLKSLEKDSSIQAYSSRIDVFGMASSSSGSYGVDIYGVNPDLENQVFGLHQRLVDGKYLEGIKRNPIVIGQKLAKRLNVKLRSKIVLNFQDIEGEITSAAFRIAGIYHVTSSAYEESHVFVKKEDLQSLLGGHPDLAHQIICRVDDYQNASKIARKIEKSLPLSADMQVQSWDQVAPELAYVNDLMIYFFAIFMGIILLGLSMGILNTMLMAVLERTRELGMLMAIGMSKVRLFGMIMIETFFLTCTGLPLGLALSWLSIQISAYYGINMSAVGEGFAAIGYSTMIYPTLSTREYIGISIMVFCAAILSAIYPALRALKLKPAEAIRKV